MHPDIEKLIELALSDGLMTDKEREIILRKAEKLGLDCDEVEMFMEGKISDYMFKNPNNFNIKSQNDSNNGANKDFIPRVVKNIAPAKLDNKIRLLNEIEILENQRRSIFLETDDLNQKILNKGSQIKSILEANLTDAENRKNELLDKLNKSFVNKANSLFKRKFGLELKNNLPELTSILIKGNYEELRSTEFFWINRRAKYFYVEYFLVTISGFLLFSLPFFLPNIRQDDKENSIALLVIWLIISVFFLIKKPQFLYKRVLFQTVFSDNENSKFLKDKMQLIKNEFKISLDEINSLESIISSYQELLLEIKNQ
jgi:hypothetical protein